MKKVKQTNSQESQNYNNQLNQDRMYALQLYEKGVLSAASLLDRMGFDSSQEIQRKKKDVVTFAPFHNEVPNWSVLSNKVEQARRNAEMVAKIMGAREAELNNEIRKQLEETLLDSLKILKETNNIK